MKIGILGVGRMGLVHARNLARHPDVDEVLLLGRDAGRLAAASTAMAADAGTVPAARVSTAVFGERFPAGMDGVVIATTTASHPTYARLAADQAIPALVEKPLAMDLDEMQRLIADLGRTGSATMVGFHRRYDPGYRALRARVQDGDVGTVRIVRGTSLDHHPLSDAYIPLSGGVWRDLLVHDFDVVPWLTGQRIVSVAAFGAVLDDPAYARYGDADTATAVLVLASGAIATLSGSRRNGAGQDVRTEVYGTLGAFEAGLDDSVPIVSTEPEADAAPRHVHDDFIGRFRAAFTAEADHFVRLVQGRADNLTPPEASLASLRVALAAERSFRAGGEVTPVE